MGELKKFKHIKILTAISSLLLVLLFIQYKNTETYLVYLSTSYHLDQLLSQRTLLLCIITSMYEASASVLDIVFTTHMQKLTPQHMVIPHSIFFHLLLPIWLSNCS